ncbi:ubiquitin/metalloprotease fusion protein [Purpureocillium lilacinum]|nr:ubiquitin/metalloprotease fusion protein [Purpureocillium lilacinum]OAQ79620.1 ubiquitin/metalloprotease fusion protein [Purpureocillium lilacinum]OAQ88980.1 ubiquitin/metalloprotease fusion protein [Purpureocillium lilacinum]GJN73922.1 hypothetical protein PLICBS_008006 [Purpureocillium lilacinum]GJN84436.1 hypothetical protein PLIIFM63780_007993 [Purpureocillium lilacinum]
MADDGRATTPVSPAAAAAAAPATPSAASDVATDADAGFLTIVVSHRKHNYSFELPDDATVADLFDDVAATLDIPTCNQKMLVPRGPLLKMPFKDPAMTLHSLQGKTLTLMGTPAAEVQAVNTMADRVARRNAARAAQRAKAHHGSHNHNHKPRSVTAADDARYTFLQVRPLDGLPRPERSLALLHRLKEDPGIRAAMRKHRFVVSLLTEMEPLAHTQTTHEGTSRTLGLNRNRGEVIELRLRTDAHDGYRDYKTIRKTLCHELAHNVHGPHDRNFWDLCHQIEREVDAADWKTGGRTISGDTSRYTISGQARHAYEDDEDDVHEDEGGWTGGEFVLGGVSSAAAAEPGMSRREVLAQAALERQRKETGAERKACDALAKGWRPCQRPDPDETK